MVMYVFLGLNEAKAARKAIDFWYRRLRDQMSLMDFLKRCRRGSGKRPGSESTDFFVVYRGPSPAARKRRKKRDDAEEEKS
jgi:hypothetical protein